MLNENKGAGMQKKIRVLIVDDSAVVRQCLSEIINSDPNLEVMAAAVDPFIAAEKMRHERPDVIVLDVEMPRMDGLTFLRKLMAQHPIPVVICSSLVAEKSATYIEAMAAGAVDVICKPQMAVKSFLNDSHRTIIETVKAASKARVFAHRPHKVESKHSADVILAPPANATAMTQTTEKIVAVGISTGGPEALRIFLEAMPPDSPAIVVVQHMPAAFTRAFAERLNTSCAITVSEAKRGDRLLRGHALIAPGNQHLLVQRSGATYQIDIKDGPPVSRHRPSVDVLFRSVARVAGRNAIGVIMTGMGDDGARGLKEMRAANAYTFGQDEASCVVYGMPKEAKIIGAVDEELPLERLAGAVLRISRSDRAAKG
jgi:two-component system, chemotaxis family, protein-glutamate methylesterase/glutaminase